MNLYAGMRTRRLYAAAVVRDTVHTHACAYTQISKLQYTHAVNDDCAELLAEAAEAMQLVLKARAELAVAVAVVVPLAAAVAGHHSSRQDHCGAELPLKYCCQRLLLLLLLVVVVIVCSTVVL
jgi:hypothetical protein